MVVDVNNDVTVTQDDDQTASTLANCVLLIVHYFQQQPPKNCCIAQILTMLGKIFCFLFSERVCFIASVLLSG